MHAIYISVIILLIVVVVFLYARLHKIKSAANVFVNMCTRGAPLRDHIGIAHRKDVDAAINAAYEQGDFGKSTLADACHDALVGGKRIRSVMLLEVGRIVCSDADLIEAALAIECIHAASLIVDDLPEFDNDIERRGRPSIHAKYGPAVAKLAALALMSAAFQSICYQINWLKANGFKNPDATGILIINYIAKSLGGKEGISLGQFMDISAVSGNDLSELMLCKTGCLFRLSIVMGYLFAGGDASMISEIDEIGADIGTAFQIADDIGDMAQDANGNINYALANGHDAAMAKMNTCIEAATASLKAHGLCSDMWEEEIIPLVRSMAS